MKKLIIVAMILMSSVANAAMTYKEFSEGVATCSEDSIDVALISMGKNIVGSSRDYLENQWYEITEQQKDKGGYYEKTFYFNAIDFIFKSKHKKPLLIKKEYYSYCIKMFVEQSKMK